VRQQRPCATGVICKQSGIAGSAACDGADDCKLTIDFRDGPDGSVLWQLAHTALYELAVRHHGPVCCESGGVGEAHLNRNPVTLTPALSHRMGEGEHSPLASHRMQEEVVAGTVILSPKSPPWLALQLLPRELRSPARVASQIPEKRSQHVIPAKGVT